MGSSKAMIFATALLLVVGSVWAQTPTNGFLFNDPEDQAGFTEAVRKSGIKFSVRDDGALIYNPADEARVTKVRSQFLEDNFTPSSHFPNPALEAKVIAAFDAAKIPHGVRTRNGERYITWAKGDNERARAIVEAEINAWVKND